MTAKRQSGSKGNALKHVHYISFKHSYYYLMVSVRVFESCMLTAFSLGSGGLQSSLYNPWYTGKEECNIHLLVVNGCRKHSSIKILAENSKHRHNRNPTVVVGILAPVSQTRGGTELGLYEHQFTTLYLKTYVRNRQMFGLSFLNFCFLIGSSVTQGPTRGASLRFFEKKVNILTIFLITKET